VDLVYSSKAESKRARTLNEIKSFKHVFGAGDMVLRERLDVVSGGRKETARVETRGGPCTSSSPAYTAYEWGSAVPEHEVLP